MNDRTVIETEFDPSRLHLQETVFSLGNGYLGTRGAFEEGYPGGWPATLINGLYDDVPIFNTELVNCPDWTSLNILVNGERFRLDRGEVLSYYRELDLQKAELSRDVRWRSPNGQTIDLHFKRLASLADPHILLVQCQITPLDQDSKIEIQAGLNGYPDNQGVLHWQILDQGGDDSLIWLHLRTRHTNIELGMASALSIQGGGRKHVLNLGCPGMPTQTAECQVQKGKTITFTKLVTIYTSRDPEFIADSGEFQLPHQQTNRVVVQPGTEKQHEENNTRPLSVATMATSKLEQLLEQKDRYQSIGLAHREAWASVWRDCDIVIEGDPKAQLAVRFNLFQILTAAPRHDDRVSIPAKTLSGFGYRGHVFWDTEIFIIPFLTHTQPELARNLLGYRYHTLPGARRKAHSAGYQGAMFAWESGSSGDEVTPRWATAPDGKNLVRIWCGDIELHISADVAYAIQRYWQATGDDDWMRNRGAEIILDTAVFWGSRAEWYEEKKRFEITGIIGPDEYHEHVDNNAFTNEMVRHHLETAREVLEWIRRTDPKRAEELERKFDLSPERLQLWESIVQTMYIPQEPGSGLIEQFENFFKLEYVDISAYEPRQQSMQAILDIEGANRSQVIKQADVLMLLYLLHENYNRQTIQVNWDYYSPRTDHTYGSSLGPCIHTILACELEQPETAYEHFMRAALVDLEDVRGNAQDGIHAASAGGLWQAAVFGFGGLRLTADGPKASPRLPAHWTRLQFRFYHRGRWYDFDFKQAEIQAGQPFSNQDIANDPSPEIRSPGSPAPDIRGVIFDLDGVLTDTSEFHYLAWQRLADEEHLPFDRQINEDLRGIPRRESLLRILDGRPANEEEIQQMMDRKNHYYQELVEGVTRDNLLPGVMDLLKELRAAGIKTAIGSASKNATTVIDRLGISDLVDAISDGNSVKQHKPAPDLFLHAAGQLGLSPEHCLVVEDARSGVEASLAAGMWALGLGPKERVGSAHIILPSLEGVHWPSLSVLLMEAAKKSISH